MMVTMTGIVDRVDRYLLSGAAIRDAWADYLVACRTTTDDRADYDDVEARAWSRLQTELAKLEREND